MPSDADKAPPPSRHDHSFDGQEEGVATSAELRQLLGGGLGEEVAGRLGRGKGSPSTRRIGSEASPPMTSALKTAWSRLRMSLMCSPARLGGHPKAATDGHLKTGHQR